MYSALVLDRATSVCSLEAHIMGYPAYMMIQPEHDLAVMLVSALAP